MVAEIDSNRCRKCGVYAGEELTWHGGCVYCTWDEEDELKVELDFSDLRDDVPHGDYEESFVETKMKDNEVYHGLVGKIISRWWVARSFGDDAEGTPGSVEFNWQRIMDREDSRGDIVGFYHTHPHFVGQPSSTDYATMKGWTLSFGRPLLCLIEGTDGLNANWFKDDETPHVKGYVKKIGKWYFGNVPRFD